jgi:uncharacterized protein (TIGR03790 family)
MAGPDRSTHPRIGLARSLCLLALSAVAAPAAAQTGHNVLVVVNESSAESREIGEYYARRRQIPEDQVLRLKLPTADEIDRATYTSAIEGPIGAWFLRGGAWDRILYIVLTKGVPLRVTGTAGLNGTVASVDSELTLLYRKLSGGSFNAVGPIRNPYYQEKATPRDFKPFTHEEYDVFLVTRLDGFTTADVKALIDRGMSPSREGEIVLDGRIEAASRTPGNSWLERTATVLAGVNGWRDRVTLDTGGKRAGTDRALFGYYSWGSNDITVQLIGAPELTFAPGALAALFVSTDARTFRQPPSGWRPGGSAFAGSNQSLTGTLIRQGATGAAGHVAEPYLDAAIRPDLLFPGYVTGLNLAEAFYAAMPFLSWQTVVIGDPLCAPFREAPLDPARIDRGVDPTSTLPVFFTQHRLRSPGRGDIREDAWKLLMRAEGFAVRGDSAGAREALERATASDDRLVTAHLTLASMHETSSEWDAAIARYRQVLATAPSNVIALNNLAYALAVRKNTPREALPLAERAHSQSKGHPLMADTLAWVHHLLGDDKKATPLIREAAKQLPGHAEIQWHAAVILAGIGANAEAAAALEKAIAADPKLAEQADVRALRAKLGGRR